MIEKLEKVPIYHIQHDNDASKRRRKMDVMYSWNSGERKWLPENYRAVPELVFIFFKVSTFHTNCYTLPTKMLLVHYWSSLKTETSPSTFQCHCIAKENIIIFLFSLSHGFIVVFTKQLGFFECFLENNFAYAPNKLKM